MKNKWRSLFFLILGINIVGFFIIFILIKMPVEQEKLDNRQTNLNDPVTFQIKTNKADLNKVINHYLESEGLTGNFHYEVLLADEVELYGTLPVFSQNISMKLTFEPEALENGDLILRQKSMTVGQLPLPASYVLKFIKDKYKMPKWVQIQPNDETIYVSFQTMKLKSDLRVKIDHFDLRKDEIALRLMLPVN